MGMSTAFQVHSQVPTQRPGSTGPGLVGKQRDGGCWGRRGGGALIGPGMTSPRAMSSSSHVVWIRPQDRARPGNVSKSLCHFWVRLLSFQKDLPPFPGHFQPSQECRATRWQESGPCRLLEKSPLPPPRTATLSE